MVDLEVVRETVHELYGPTLRQIGRPEFHNSYPNHIDTNNPYPMGYKVHDFSLFTKEDNQSSIEHIARFTIQYMDLEKHGKFQQLEVAFSWYASIPRNSIMNW